MHLLYLTRNPCCCLLFPCRLFFGTPRSGRQLCRWVTQYFTYTYFKFEACGLNSCAGVHCGFVTGCSCSRAWSICMTTLLPALLFCSVGEALYITMQWHSHRHIVQLQWHNSSTAAAAAVLLYMGQVVVTSVLLHDCLLSAVFMPSSCPCHDNVYVQESLACSLALS